MSAQHAHSAVPANEAEPFTKQLWKEDDTFGALLLALVVWRRWEFSRTRPGANPEVPVEQFERRRRALRTLDWVAWSTLAKIALDVSWPLAAVALGVAAPWVQLGRLIVFVGWVVSLVWAWKAAIDVRYRGR